MFSFCEDYVSLPTWGFIYGFILLMIKCLGGERFSWLWVIIPLFMPLIFPVAVTLFMALVYGNKATRRWSICILLLIGGLCFAPPLYQFICMSLLLIIFGYKLDFLGDSFLIIAVVFLFTIAAQVLALYPNCHSM